MNMEQIKKIEQPVLLAGQTQTGGISNTLSTVKNPNTNQDILQVFLSNVPAYDNTIDSIKISNSVASNLLTKSELTYNGNVLSSSNKLPVDISTATMESKLDTLNTNITTTSTTNGGKIDSTNSKLDLVKASTDSIKTSTDSIKSSVDLVKTSTDTINTSIGLTNTKLDSLNINSTDSLTKLGEIKGEIVSNHAEVVVNSSYLNTIRHTDGGIKRINDPIFISGQTSQGGISSPLGVINDPLTNQAILKTYKVNEVAYDPSNNAFKVQSSNGNNFITNSNLMVGGSLVGQNNKIPVDIGTSNISQEATSLLIKTNTDTLITNSTTTNTKLGDINTSLTTNGTKIDGIKTDTTSIKTDSSTISTNTNDIKTTLNTQSTKLDTIATNITTNTTNVQTNGGKIDTLSAKLPTNLTASGNLKTAISESVVLQVSDNNSSLTVDGVVDSNLKQNGSIISPTNRLYVETDSNTINTITSIKDGVKISEPVQIMGIDGNTLQPSTGLSTISHPITKETILKVYPAYVPSYNSDLNSTNISQINHDNLNMNANLQINNQDVTPYNKVPVEINTPLNFGAINSSNISESMSLSYTKDPNNNAVLRVCNVNQACIDPSTDSYKVSSPIFGNFNTNSNVYVGGESNSIWNPVYICPSLKQRIDLNFYFDINATPLDMTANTAIPLNQFINVSGCALDTTNKAIVLNGLLGNNIVLAGKQFKNVHLVDINFNSTFTPYAPTGTPANVQKWNPVFLFQAGKVRSNYVAVDDFTDVPFNIDANVEYSFGRKSRLPIPLYFVDTDTLYLTLTHRSPESIRINANTRLRFRLVFEVF